LRSSSFGRFGPFRLDTYGLYLWKTRIRLQIRLHEKFGAENLVTLYPLAFRMGSDFGPKTGSTQNLRIKIWKIFGSHWIWIPNTASHKVSNEPIKFVSCHLYIILLLKIRSRRSRSCILVVLRLRIHQNDAAYCVSNSQILFLKKLNINLLF
jgi:hypothetical protein